MLWYFRSSHSRTCPLSSSFALKGIELLFNAQVADRSPVPDQVMASNPGQPPVHPFGSYETGAAFSALGVIVSQPITNMPVITVVDNECLQSDRRQSKSSRQFFDNGSLIRLRSDAARSKVKRPLKVRIVEE
jgi:hypothetical protein